MTGPISQTIAVIAAIAAMALIAIATGRDPTRPQNPRIVPTPHPIVGELPAAPAEIYLPEPPGIVVSTWIPGLEAVWSMQFAPDGRLFLTEKPGRVRVVDRQGTLQPDAWATLPVVPRGGEGGLMGLALHPEFPREPWVYVMYTTFKDGARVNRVSRFREVNGRGTGEAILIDDLPAALNHNGGRLIFGPDRMLYVSAGDAYHPMAAQDLGTPAGSILRVTPDGRVPPDNPWPGNPIWARGLRNPNGLAFRPRDGVLFAADHGPTSEWANPRVMDRDELNLITRGGNYGWPVVVGAARQKGLIDPLLAFIPSTPPGALIFYDHAQMPQLRGDLFYTSLTGQALLRIRFQDAANPTRITAIERWFNTGPRGESGYGRLRALAVGPDGALYIGTSNRDGRGVPRAGDDRILRITR